MTMTPIPLVNLKPALEETAPQWRSLLEALYERAHFVLGEQVEAFERDFATATGAEFAIGVGSGTSAIELCLRAAQITQSSQQVLTSALTAPFTGLAILAAGASPRFADVDPETLLLNPGDVENRAVKRTEAILPVHLYGQPCNLPRFARLARALKIRMVQDACQAHGARYRGRPFTDYSPFVAYSFYPTKNLGCLGDGGAVVTSSRSVARRVRLLRDGGRGAHHVSVVPGVNSRLDEMQACYLSAFLPNLGGWNAARARIAALYDEELAECSGVRLVRRWPCSVNHLYVIRVKRRDRLRTFLAQRAIATGVHYPVPLHLHPAFEGCGARRGDLPHAELAAQEIMSLPIWPYLQQSDVLRVSEAIRAFFAS